MVISSSFPAVAARCAHVHAGVGAVARQNVTGPALDPELPERLAEGPGARAALEAVTAGRPIVGWRQLLVMGTAGQVAIHSGAPVLGLAGAARGRATSNGRGVRDLGRRSG